MLLLNRHLQNESGKARYRNVYDIFKCQRCSLPTKEKHRFAISIGKRNINEKATLSKSQCRFKQKKRKHERFTLITASAAFIQSSMTTITYFYQQNNLIKELAHATHKLGPRPLNSMKRPIISRINYLMR